MFCTSFRRELYPVNHEVKSTKFFESVNLCISYIVPWPQKLSAGLITVPRIVGFSQLKGRSVVLWVFWNEWSKSINGLMYMLHSQYRRHWVEIIIFEDVQFLSSVEPNVKTLKSSSTGKVWEKRVKTFIEVPSHRFIFKLFLSISYRPWKTSMHWLTSKHLTSMPKGKFGRIFPTSWAAREWNPKVNSRFGALRLLVNRE